jgi:hypothetical protein
MRIDRPVLLFLTLALLVAGPRWVEARCPPPPPLPAASENADTRTPAIQQEMLENGGPRTITATRLEDEASIDIDGRPDEAIWWRVIPVGDFIQIFYTHRF